MMAFKLEFKTDNDAFLPSAGMEIVSVLRDVVRRVDERIRQGEPTGGVCYDSNGNAVGTWSYTP